VEIKDKTWTIKGDCQNCPFLSGCDGRPVLSVVEREEEVHYRIEANCDEQCYLLDEVFSSEEAAEKGLYTMYGQSPEWDLQEEF
jgi:hypothetical protein